MELTAADYELIRDCHESIDPLEASVQFAICCALACACNAEFVGWAIRWLTKRDRSEESARKIHQQAKYEAYYATGAALLWAIIYQEWPRDIWHTQFRMDVNRAARLSREQGVDTVSFLYTTMAALQGPSTSWN